MGFMSAGKGDSPRAVNGARFRTNYERIWSRITEIEADVGAVIDGHECLGGNGWQTIDHIPEELRDEE